MNQASCARRRHDLFRRQRRHGASQYRHHACDVLRHLLHHAAHAEEI